MKRLADTDLTSTQNKRVKNEDFMVPKNVGSYLPIDCKNSFLRAAEEEDWKMLKWLTIQDGVEYDQDVISIVAENKNLEMLKYLITECGMMLDDDALIAATENEDFEMLKWMVEDQGKELAIDGMEVRLNEEPNLEIVRWVYIKNPCAQINYTDVVSLNTQGYIQTLEGIAQIVEELVSSKIAPSSPLILDTKEELAFLLEVFQEQLLKKGLPDDDFESYKAFLDISCADVFPENIRSIMIKALNKIGDSLVADNIPKMNLELSELSQNQRDDSVGMTLAGETDYIT